MFLPGDHRELDNINLRCGYYTNNFGLALQPRCLLKRISSIRLVTKDNINNFKVNDNETYNS